MHNGTIEHVVKLPVGTKSAQLGLNNEEEVVPVVAFKERRSLRTLTGLEEIQTHQRAGNWDNVWKCLQDESTSPPLFLMLQDGALFNIFADFSENGKYKSGIFRGLIFMNVRSLVQIQVKIPI